MKTRKIMRLGAIAMVFAMLCTLFAGCGSTAVQNGKSAYELAVENGYVGTELEWLASLAGEAGKAGADGKSAYELAVENGYNFTYPKLCAIQAERHGGVDALKGVCVETEGTLLTSAVKKAEADNGVIVRMYNPLQDTARISSKQAFRKTNLAENADEALANACDVASKKIVTIKF